MKKNKNFIIVTYEFNYEVKMWEIINTYIYTDNISEYLPDVSDNDPVLLLNVICLDDLG